MTRTTVDSPRPGHRFLDLVGVLGEILITLGVLVGLFVVWQMWWTDVVAEQAQSQIVEDLGWSATPSVSPDEPEPVQDRGPAPVMDEPDPGTTFAVMVVPRWSDTQLPVSQGTDKHEVLDRLGVGHYAGTAMPGAIGNFAVAGHRTTYGKPFNRIEELEIGDPVIVRTSDTWYVYRVTSSEVVSPQRTDVIDQVPSEPDAIATEPIMTMTTCHPMYSARERYIVHALLDYWMPADEGSPAELDEVVD
jgi:sortase A